MCWVEIETPTGDVENMARLLDVVAADFAPLGASLERIPGREGMGDHLLVRLPWGSGPGILSVCHLDTVCPPGSVAMRRDGDRFHGPGIADMKAGGHLAFKAAEHLAGIGGLLESGELVLREEGGGRRLSTSLFSRWSRR